MILPNKRPIARSNRLQPTILWTITTRLEDIAMPRPWQLPRSGQCQVIDFCLDDGSMCSLRIVRGSESAVRLAMACVPLLRSAGI
jgi:hypothetical protein